MRIHLYSENSRIITVGVYMVVIPKNDGLRQFSATKQGEEKVVVRESFSQKIAGQDVTKEAEAKIVSFKSNRDGNFRPREGVWSDVLDRYKNSTLIDLTIAAIPVAPLAFSLALLDASVRMGSFMFMPAMAGTMVFGMIEAYLLLKTAGSLIDDVKSLFSPRNILLGKIDCDDGKTWYAYKTALGTVRFRCVDKDQILDRNALPGVYFGQDAPSGTKVHIKGFEVSEEKNYTLTKVPSGEQKADSPRGYQKEIEQ